MATFVAVAGMMAALWSAVLGMAVWSLVNGEGDAWMVWTTGMTLFSWVSFGIGRVAQAESGRGDTEV